MNYSKLHENWRAYCEQNDVQLERGYLLIESGPLRHREKRDFETLLEDVSRGSLKHDKFLKMWQESVDYEIGKLESELLEEGVAEITQKIVMKFAPAIMNMIANALQYIQKFLAKINDMSTMMFIKGQQVVAGIMTKAARLAKKTEPYIGPTFKIMAVVGMIFILFGSMGALASTGAGDTVDPEQAKLLKASLKLAHDCQEIAGGVDALDPDITQSVMTRIKNAGTGGEGIDFNQTFSMIRGETMGNNCVRAAESIEQALRNGAPLDGLEHASPAVKATIKDIQQSAEALRDLNPESFEKAVELGDKMEVLQNSLKDNLYSQGFERGVTSGSGGIENVNFSEKLNSVLNTVSKKFIHIKGETMPGMNDVNGNPIEMPMNAVQHALEKSPDLLSKGTEQEIAKAVIQSAKELGQETGKVVTRTNDNFWVKLIKQLPG